MKSQLIFLFLLIVIGGLITSNNLHAQLRGNSDWNFQIVPYLWYSNLGVAETLDDLGTFPSNHFVGDFNVPIVSKTLGTDWAFRGELGKKRIRGILILSDAQVKTNTPITSIDSSIVDAPAKSDLTWFTGELFGAVAIGPFKEDLAIELYAGGRYTKQEQKVESDSLQGMIDINQTWVDPVMGARFYIKVGKRWWTMINSDIGGFGIGSGSNLTWTLGAEFGFEIFKHVDISMRYNYQEVEFENGKDGADRFIWDNGVQQGWFFGLTFKN